MAIPKIYSQQELDRRRDIYTRVWHLENIGRPALHVWRNPEVMYPTNEVLENPRLLLKSQIDGMEVRSQDKSDCPPFLYPYAGVGVLPSAFGCEVILREGQEPLVAPMLDKPEDVYKLKKPKPNTGQGKVILDQLKCLSEANEGYYDIRMHDLQGPFSVASLIWGYEEFLLGVYSNPEEAHHLLRLTTEAIIDITKAQQQIVENLILCHCVPDWIAPGYGIAISDDIAAVVSPKVYEEFVVPYNNILSDHFGGIFIHSCGNSSPNFDTVLKHKNFRGINFEAGDTPYPLAVEKLGGRSLIAPHPGLQFIPKYGNAVRYVKYLKENSTPGMPYVITLYDQVIDSATLESVVDDSLDEAIEMVMNGTL